MLNLSAHAALSGLDYVDALIGDGPQWNAILPQRNHLFFGFSVTEGVPAVDTEVVAGPVQPFNPDQQAAVHRMLDEVSAITGIGFTLAGAGQAVDILFAQGDIVTGTRTLGLSSWQQVTTGVSWVNATGNLAVTAQVYLDNAEWSAVNALPVPGTQAYQTLLHEFGHVLGLKHPFAGSITLPSEQDNSSYTLMSYTQAGGFASTFAPYDVAALRWLYGGDGLAGARGATSLQHWYTGTPWNDMLAGSVAADVLEGREGDDRLVGNGGNDELLGGDGLDVAVCAGLRSSWRLQAKEHGFQLQHAWGDAVQLQEVERIVFEDGALALDLQGAAGDVVRIMGAVLGPLSVTERPDYVGLGLSWRDAGMSPEAIVQYAIAAVLGPSPQVSDLIDLLYRNIAGRLPAQAEYDYWLQHLSATGQSLAELAWWAADLEENETNIGLSGLLADGIDFQPVARSGLAGEGV